MGHGFNSKLLNYQRVDSHGKCPKELIRLSVVGDFPVRYFTSPEGNIHLKKKYGKSPLLMGKFTIIADFP